MVLAPCVAERLHNLMYNVGAIVLVARGVYIKRIVLTPSNLLYLGLA